MHYHNYSDESPDFWRQEAGAHTSVTPQSKLWEKSAQPAAAAWASSWRCRSVLDCLVRNNDVCSARTDRTWWAIALEWEHLVSKKAEAFRSD